MKWSFKPAAAEGEPKACIASANHSYQLEMPGFKLPPYIEQSAENLGRAGERSLTGRICPLVNGDWLAKICQATPGNGRWDLSLQDRLQKCTEFVRPTLRLSFLLTQWAQTLRFCGRCWIFQPNSVKNFVVLNYLDPSSEAMIQTTVSWSFLYGFAKQRFSSANLSKLSTFYEFWKWNQDWRNLPIPFSIWPLKNWRWTLSWSLFCHCHGIPTIKIPKDAAALRRLTRCNRRRSSRTCKSQSSN